MARRKRRKPLDTIPGASRALVRQRERHRCLRCGSPAPNGQVHHRRTRAVVDFHQHCACCLVFLCGSCHRWAHANPVRAREDGWIVSRYVAEPGTVTVKTKWGERRHLCDGSIEWLSGVDGAEG